MFTQKRCFIDLFAGAGGLSEGFIQAGFEPVAHVESDQAACFTLRTRMAYHWLCSQGQLQLYMDYLKGKLSREDLYKHVPKQVIGSVIKAEISEQILPDIFRQVDVLCGNRQPDLIVGGPPCQAYSLIGRSRDRNRMKGDIRNYLYIHYAEFLRKYRPLYFVFENVTGLLSAKEENGEHYLDAMQSLFLDCGYETKLIPLSAKDYGVLQNRKRIIIVGRRGESVDFCPVPTKRNSDIQVREIFFDLPELQAGEGNPRYAKYSSNGGEYLYESGIKSSECEFTTLHWARPHNNRDKKIYRRSVNLWNEKKKRIKYTDLPPTLRTHRNCHSFLDRFKVVASDLPSSQTVVAHIAKDGHYYIHPDAKQNRSITPREAARLQTFPDDYYFESRNGVPQRTAAYRQIGNAVPVLLARKIAEKLNEVWL